MLVGQRFDGSDITRPPEHSGMAGDTDGSGDSELAEFLDEKWAVEILCEVDENGARYTDIQDRLRNVSTGTLSTRLERAREIGLLEKGIVQTSDGESEGYVLTNRGGHLRFMMRAFGVTTAYEQLRQARANFYPMRNALVDWTGRKGDRFDDPTENKQFRIMHDSDIPMEEFRSLMSGEDDSPE